MLPMMWKRADGHQAGPLPDHPAKLAAAAEAPVLHRVVVGLADGDLLEAVPLDPAVFVGAPEVRPELRAEPVEQVEERRARIPAHQGPRLRLRDVPQTSARTPAAMPWAEPRPLYSCTSSVDEQVEEAPHPVLHVVGQGVAGGAGLVRLPQGSRRSGRR